VRGGALPLNIRHEPDAFGDPLMLQNKSPLYIELFTEVEGLYRTRAADKQRK
jgi:hypothetical protein